MLQHFYRHEHCHMGSTRHDQPTTAAGLVTGSNKGLFVLLWNPPPPGATHSQACQTLGPTTFGRSLTHFASSLIGKCGLQPQLQGRALAASNVTKTSRTKSMHRSTEGGWQADRPKRCGSFVLFHGGRSPLRDGACGLPGGCLVCRMRSNLHVREGGLCAPWRALSACWHQQNLISDDKCLPSLPYSCASPLCGAGRPDALPHQHVSLQLHSTDGLKRNSGLILCGAILFGRWYFRNIFH